MPETLVSSLTAVREWSFWMKSSDRNFQQAGNNLTQAAVTTIQKKPKTRQSGYTGHDTKYSMTQSKRSEIPNLRRHQRYIIL